MVAAAGFGWQSTITVDGAYLTAIMFPGILMMLGGGRADGDAAGRAGHVGGADPGEAGLVSGLVNTSRTMGGSLGLAVMSTVAAARTEDGAAPGAAAEGPVALVEGYASAFRASAVVLVVGGRW
ncbi:hypothetical protein GCM10020295_59360 [Streptomyces cinereospinus]